ncbi:MAG TPA: hypothetical protein VFG43_17280 [Geminicoccaceae bacterium]|nr:hypothetical protein [Geminicoccaceae bacterium]
MAKLKESTTAVIVRGERPEGAWASEPYECGWATEAVLFARLLEPGENEPAPLRVQISPDGMRWADEGTILEVPNRADAVTFARIGHFGNWLRVKSDAAAGGAQILVTLHLKE